MRDVAQESRLLFFQIVQARAKPLESLPKIAHVLWAVDLDGMGEVCRAHLPHCLIKLADGASEQHRERDGEHKSNRCRRECQVRPRLASLCSHFLKALDLALRQSGARGEHRLRPFGKIGVALGQGRAGHGRTLRRLEQRVEPAFAIGDLFELRKLKAIQWKLLQLPGGRAEVRARYQPVYSRLPGPDSQRRSAAVPLSLCPV